MKDKIIYYTDELNDEFSGITQETICVDENFKYDNRNFLWNITSFIFWKVIVLFFTFIYIKVFLRVKFINKSVIRNHMKTGGFIYANHTHQFSDAFSPNILCVPKFSYTICNADNVSAPGCKNLMMMLGLIPIPTKRSGLAKFMQRVEEVSKKNFITIYPEAHIWPYYTKIRPFTNVSFRYPIKFNKPVFSLTTVYKKRKYSRKPRIEIFVDGPFFPDNNLEFKLQQQKLRDEVYNAMVNRSKENEIEMIKYIKK